MTVVRDVGPRRGGQPAELIALALTGLLWVGCSGASGGSPAAPSAQPTSLDTSSRGSPVPTAALAPTALPASPSRSTASAATTKPSDRCPPEPWTLASLVSVPELSADPALWPGTPIRRASCFGRAAVSFEAIGGGAMNAVPGVVLPKALGAEFLWFSLLPAVGGPNDFLALLPPGRLGHPETVALERTRNPEPGVGWAGGTWWRVTGHFDDPGAGQCRSKGPWELDTTLIEYTTAQAVEVCRELFVIDRLTWLSTAPPTG